MSAKIFYEASNRKNVYWEDHLALFTQNLDEVRRDVTSDLAENIRSLGCLVLLLSIPAILVGLFLHLYTWVIAGILIFLAMFYLVNWIGMAPDEENRELSRVTIDGHYVVRFDRRAWTCSLIGPFEEGVSVDHLIALKGPVREDVPWSRVKLVLSVQATDPWSDPPDPEADMKDTDDGGDPISWLGLKITPERSGGPIPGGLEGGFDLSDDLDLDMAAAPYIRMTGHSNRNDPDPWEVEPEKIRAREAFWKRQAIARERKQKILSFIYGTERPQPHQRKSLVRGSCPFCKNRFLGSGQEAIVQCDRCNTLHHLDCWNQKGGCSIFGCQSTTHHSAQ